MTPDQKIALVTSHGIENASALTDDERAWIRRSVNIDNAVAVCEIIVARRVAEARREAEERGGQALEDLAQSYLARFKAEMPGIRERAKRQARREAGQPT